MWRSDGELRREECKGRREGSAGKRWAEERRWKSRSRYSRRGRKGETTELGERGNVWQQNKWSRKLKVSDQWSKNHWNCSCSVCTSSSEPDTFVSSLSLCPFPLGDTLLILFTTKTQHLADNLCVAFTSPSVMRRNRRCRDLSYRGSVCLSNITYLTAMEQTLFLKHKLRIIVIVRLCNNVLLMCTYSNQNYTIILCPESFQRTLGWCQTNPTSGSGGCSRELSHPVAANPPIIFWLATFFNMVQYKHNSLNENSHSHLSLATI